MGREAYYKVWSIWSDELMFNFKDMMTGCHGFAIKLPYGVTELET